ncbi:zonula adherens maintenance [Branchiostoma belcheri]|nr:zonula adherens maintenance [Branchiostoma belcheri]
MPDGSGRAGSDGVPSLISGTAVRGKFVDAANCVGTVRTPFPAKDGQGRRPGGQHPDKALNALARHLHPQQVDDHISTWRESTPGAQPEFVVDEKGSQRGQPQLKHKGDKNGARVWRCRAPACTAKAESRAVGAGRPSRPQKGGHPDTELLKVIEQIDQLKEESWLSVQPRKEGVHSPVYSIAIAQSGTCKLNLKPAHPAHLNSQSPPSTYLRNVPAVSVPEPPPVPTTEGLGAESRAVGAGRPSRPQKVGQHPDKALNALARVRSPPSHPSQPSSPAQQPSHPSQPASPAAKPSQPAAQPAKPAQPASSPATPTWPDSQNWRCRENQKLGCNARVLEHPKRVFCHLGEHKHPPKQPTDPAEGTLQNKRYKCHLCSYSIDKKQRLDQHMEKQHLHLCQTFICIRSNLMIMSAPGGKAHQGPSQEGVCMSGRPSDHCRNWLPVPIRKIQKKRKADTARVSPPPKMAIKAELQLRNSQIETANTALQRVQAELAEADLDGQLQGAETEYLVFARLRPLLSPDANPANDGLDDVPHFDWHNGNILEVDRAMDGDPNETMSTESQKIEFTFDRVFAPSSSQAAVFEEISQLVQDQARPTLWRVHMQVMTLADVNDVFPVAINNRATACTNMNKHSSRSHALPLLIVTVEGQISPPEQRSLVLKLNLVDLAGSERVHTCKSQAEGDRLKEAEHQQDPVYPDPFSPQQPALCGDTLMVVQVAPVEKNVKETLASLNFAQRVRTVELGQATQMAQLKERQALSPTNT